MEHARLGRTGLQVSRLCLGTMTFGLQSDERTAVAILDRAAEGGIDFLDTSDAYPLGGDLTTRGVTEEILGRWLRGKRDRFIVATKCFAPTGPAPFDARQLPQAHHGRGRGLAAAAADRLHRPVPAARLRPETPIDETLGALDDLVRPGKVRYIGCSNFLTYQLVRAIGRSETLAAGPLRLRPAPVQPAVPPDRAGDAAVLRGGRRRRHPLQPDRRRPAVRQALPVRAAAGGHPLHPRQRRGRCTRTGTGTNASSTPSTSCASWPSRPGRAWSPSPWPGCWPTRRSPRRSSAPAGPTSWTPAWPRSSYDLDDDLKQQLDERTQQYRMGDDPR